MFKLASLNQLEIVQNHVFSKKKNHHLEPVLDFPDFIPKSWCYPKKKKKEREKRSSLKISCRCLKISRQYGNPRLFSISSPCLVIEGCHCLQLTRLELCKIVQQATENYITGHNLDHPDLVENFHSTSMISHVFFLWYGLLLLLLLLDLIKFGLLFCGSC